MAQGRNRIHLAAAVMLLACFVAHSTAMPMHPDLLSFVKLPTASSSLGEELEQTAARKLQQDVFTQPEGPFTFDGFGIGFGGLFPGGGAFDGFGVNIYNILFRDILNEGVNRFVADGVTNNLQPFDFIPPEIGNLFNRDVAVLFGFDAVDKYVGQYLNRAEASLGELVDAGCVGPTYSLTVVGGECEIADDGSVECVEPTIEASSTPYICNLPFREAATLEGQSFQYKVQFGRERKGELSPLTAGEYNFGAAVNVTNPNLGFSLETRRIANDFGLQQWYQFAGNLILNELLRIQAALLSGAVDSKILTTQRDRAAAAAGDRSAIADGAAAVAEATSELLDNIAKNMGINTDDLRAGLDAVGVLPKPAQAAPAARPIPPQQRQQKPAVVPNTPTTEELEGGKVIVQNTDEREGDMALLDDQVPLVKKAEGAQPRAAQQPAPKPAAKSAPKPALKPASKPKHL